MSTFLFSDVIFGPVKSRRFGNSLGINLLPCDRKVCSFNCVYCECGWTEEKNFAPSGGLAEPNAMVEALRQRLQTMQSDQCLPDSITFAGNGEPTLHPHFLPIMQQTVALRDEFAPSARITVLTNASTAHRPDVFHALMLADNHVMKLDAGSETTFNRINQPSTTANFGKIVSNLMLFNGDLTIQTLFVRGLHGNHVIDNTTDEELDLWLGHLSAIKPRLVMIYPIARNTPASALEVIDSQELQAIAARVQQLGIETEVF